jgi:putative chitobiose transport system permease protein
MKYSVNRLRRIGLAYSFLLPTLLIIGAFQLYPISKALYYSMTDFTPLNPETQFIGLENFRYLFVDPEFWQALKNTLLYLIVVPAIIVLSLSLALLVEPSIPGIHFFRACYYVPVITMMVVVALVWKMIFDTDYGILNMLLQKTGILSEGFPWLTSEKMALFTVMTVTVWKGLGYYMVMFIVGLRTIPMTLLEAARIDGASRLQTLLFVKVPSLWPTITLVAILSSISALQVFEEIYVMTGGQVGTTTLVYLIYEKGFHMQFGGGMEMGYACAIGLVLFVLVLTFSIFTIKFLDQFNTTGGK